MSKRRIALILGVVLMLALGLYTSWRAFRSSPPATAVATLGSIDVTIQTVGVIQPTGTITVTSSAPGTIQRVAVQSGDRVTAGDILILLDQQPFNDQIAKAEDKLQQAEFALQFAERRLAQTPDDDDARAAVLSASEQVTEAQAALSDAQSALADAAITAPADGIVSQVTTREGSAVAANQPVVSMFDSTSLELVADIDELDLANVQVGAEVTFRLDAYPASEISGSVKSTDPVAHQQGGSTIFSAHVGFSRPLDLDIRPGMNADVTIVTARRDDVLLIPDRALRTVGDRSFVTVHQDGHNTEREVHLGYRGDGQVEIVAGLSEGDQVILH